MIEKLIKQGDIEVNANKCGGCPVIPGTRFPVSQLFAELDYYATDFCDDFELDEERVKNILHAVSREFHRGRI